MLDDEARLRILHDLGDVHADTDQALQAVARLAAQLCGTPMAAVSLVGEHEQVFIGATGLDIDRTARQSSFCAVAMETPSVPLLVPDTHVDPRFAGNALVTSAPHIRAYAGVPLLAAEQVPLGAVCVLSDRPHTLSDDQLTALRALAVISERLMHAERLTTTLRTTVGELAALNEAEQTSRAQFRTAFDHATTGMTLADDQGNYVRVNLAFADLLGYSVTELTGRSFRDVTADTDHNVDVAAIGELVTGARRTALREKRYRHRDGTLIPALVTSSLIQPIAGGPWQLLNSVESVAERRAAEERLVELHSAVDGIISIDEHGSVVAWNLGAQRLLGYPPAEMLGRSLERIIPANARQAHKDGAAHVASGGVPWLVGSTIDVAVVHADGHELLTEVSSSAWTQEGRPRYTAVLRDITAQRRAEQAAALVRHAAMTANSTDEFAIAAAAVVREVCIRLQWRAGHAWTRDNPRAVWHVAAHSCDPGTAPAGQDPAELRTDVDALTDCPLTALASQGAAPAAQLLPFDAGARVETGPEALAEMGPAVHRCGIGSAVAVPVLDGGEVTGTLAFYLPAGHPPAGADMVDALEQIGLALGRVVERQRVTTALTWQASHDPVTDLANRRLLLEQISHTQRSFTAEPHQRSAVLLINIDRFRLINDSLGYAAGDQILRDVATRLRHCVRDGDLVARLSADEFVVLAHHNTSATTARAIAHDGDTEPFVTLANRLLQTLCEPFNLVGHRLQLRASIGVCPINAQHANAAHYPARILRDADAALRLAKRRGKNQIQIFDAALASTTEQRIDDENALAHAIASGELALHYQPIITLATGRVTGAEALVRWQRPGHGIIAPDAFIPLAENSGLIIDLGRWVLRQACLDAASWSDIVPAMADASISVNVSARQLTHPQFLSDLDSALTDSGLGAHRLILEITETALVDDSDAVMDTLHAIRNRGIQLALDDFGTGYSSLSYVQQLPATILKIDKSFVDPITAPATGTALSEVVVKLAAAIGLRTVAEGVETPEQAAALHQLGCQRAQGYTWSRPVPQHQLQDTVTDITNALPTTRQPVT